MKKIKNYKISLLYKKDTIKYFNTLCGSKKNTILFEKREKYKIKKSFINIDTALRITAKNFKVIIEYYSQNAFNLINLYKKIIPNEIKIKEKINKIELNFPLIANDLNEEYRLCSLSILDCLRLIPILFNTQKYNLFFIGLFSYDLIYNFEPIKRKIKNFPQYCFYLSETLLIINHLKKTTFLISNLFIKSKKEKKKIKKRLLFLNFLINNNKKNKINKDYYQSQIIYCNKNDLEYSKIINLIKKFIIKGEIYQIVPSRIFKIMCTNNLIAYKKLKHNNPSPYMFYMQDKEFTLFGSSPETSIKYKNKTKKILLSPIAGTRKRGYINNKKIKKDFDNCIELELKLNNKELSEHIMLLDLARNDLSRICEYGTRYIKKMTQIDYYKFVMHLVSKIVGKLRKNLDILYAYKACINMGTLSGAPKIRAMQLISKIEKNERGIYGGGIGFFTGIGNMDTSIIIRTAYIVNKIASIQAGAGIVYDSILLNEVNESRYKAKAVLCAIADK